MHLPTESIVVKTGRGCGGDSVLRGNDRGGRISAVRKHDELLDRAASVASIATQSCSSKMTDVWKNSGGDSLISVVSGI